MSNLTSATAEPYYVNIPRDQYEQLLEQSRANRILREENASLRKTLSSMTR